MTTITGVGEVTLDALAYAALFFWHYYEVDWYVDSSPAPDQILLHAIDAHNNSPIFWKANADYGGTTTNPVFSSLKRPAPHPLSSKWLSGARDDYQGFSSFRLKFTDSRISDDPNNVFDWHPDLGDLGGDPS